MRCENPPLLDGKADDEEHGHHQNVNQRPQPRLTLGDVKQGVESQIQQPLRQKLGDYGSLIGTVRNVGYVISAGDNT